ncbi:hypothetical protein [Psychroflexus aestuariivivens]|uniref:hypothetical protein n=1 Tax=Psychroflexus aestuariivivens TaxID=1795040 RepID=UPI000FD88BDA|nr:hypothetical protein [Psychroflexus aestuariivivens]
MNSPPKNHPFYQKSKSQKLKFYGKLIGIILLFNLPFAVLAYILNLFAIVAFSFFVSLTILAPFIDVPGMVKKGKLHYFSEMLLAEQPKNNIVNIHGSSLFVYYFMLNRKQSGKQRTQFILKSFLEGLINIIDEYENDEQLKICGTSHILNARTAEKLGFELKPRQITQSVILVFNFFNILACNYLSKGKLVAPKFSNIKSFEAKISDLKANRKRLIQYKNHLKT